MPILWLDVDSIVDSYPCLDNIKHLDFAGVDHPDKQWGLDITAHCLYFNNSDIGRHLLNDWIDMCNNSVGGDHELLISVLENYGYDYRKSYIEEFTTYRITHNNLKKIKSYNYWCWIITKIFYILIFIDMKKSQLKKIVAEEIKRVKKRREALQQPGNERRNICGHKSKRRLKESSLVLLKH